LLEVKASAREHGEVWNALHFEPGGEFRMTLGIDFQHDGLAGEVSCDLRNVGRRSPAGSAPGRPKIDEDGNLAVSNDFVEFFGAHLNGLSQRD
jgi:hypothetical protein